MELPTPDWQVVFAVWFAFLFVAGGLMLLLWCLMDWYEDR